MLICLVEVTIFGVGHGSLNTAYQGESDSWPHVVAVEAMGDLGWREAGELHIRCVTVVVWGG